MPLRIFVTTDNHVGFNELDTVRGNDAANTFAEAMQIAQSSGVDLVLQAGDLFHVNKPSKRSMYQVLKTLRQTCLGDKPVEFEVVNHGQLSLDDAGEFDHVNFEDPNFNVGIPFFAISGNHDDAGGSASSESMLSPLDLLAMGGLINHFGRVHDNTKIVVKPVLIRKQGVKVALYGLANVRDERLYRTFMSGQVHFLRPRDTPDEWYNILVVHQNHTPFGPKNYLPEQFLPEFMDLVIWGHEHECRIDPAPNDVKRFLVMQPGSSVATSLSASELGNKYVAVLSIGANKEMQFEKHLLKTVRPFKLRTVSLANDARHIEPYKRDTRAKVTEWLMMQVEEMLAEADRDWAETHGADEPKMLPLIRLRVDYTGGYEMENITRFSNRFVDRVANTSDVLHLIKSRNRLRETVDLKSTPNTVLLGDSREANSKLVPFLMKEELKNEDLEILKPTGMVDALLRYVEKDEKLAIKTKVDDFVQKHAEALEKEMSQLSIASYNSDAMWEEARDAYTKRGAEGVSEGKRGAEVDGESEERASEAKRRAEIDEESDKRRAPRAKKRATQGRARSSQPAPAPAPARTVRSTRKTFEEPLFVDDDEDMFSSQE